MKIRFNGQEIGEVATNRNLTVEEALYSVGFDVEDPEDLETAYKAGFPAAYIDDDGNYAIDTENISLDYSDEEEDDADDADALDEITEHYDVFCIGGEKDGETIATFATEREAVEFAKKYTAEHETEFNPCWGGVGITDQEGNDVEW